MAATENKEALVLRAGGAARESERQKAVGNGKAVVTAFAPAHQNGANGAREQLKLKGVALESIKEEKRFRDPGSRVFGV